MLSQNAKQLMETLDKYRHLHFHDHQVVMLSHGEFMMLDYIREIKNNEKEQIVTVSSLAKKYSCSMPAISKRISSLEEKGYVKRDSIAGDRRSSSVQLTEFGEETIEHAIIEMDNFMNRIMERFGKENTLDLVRCLDKLYEILTDEIHLCGKKEKQKKKG